MGPVLRTIRSVNCDFLYLFIRRSVDAVKWIILLLLTEIRRHCVHNKNATGHDNETGIIRTSSLNGAEQYLKYTLNEVKIC